MLETICAPQAFGRKSNDAIYGANNAAKADIAVTGAEKVINGTIGTILDEQEKIVCLPTVEKVFRSLSMADIVSYAPIAGLPAYLKDAQEACFGDYRPEGFTAAVASTGGTGGIHHVIHNYTAPGEEVLTCDWYWGAYKTICENDGRRLRTYRLFDEHLHFNKASFEENVRDMAGKQERVAVVINSPAHNPTGYALTEEDWDFVLSLFTELAEKGRHIILLCDVAYLDYAGPDARKFFRKLGNLHENIFVLIGYSMSKGFTMYGMRSGALIALSCNEKLVREFREINEFTNRATWSSNVRGAQETLIRIWEDPGLRKAWEKEKEEYYTLIKERAEIFVREANEVGLPILPYQAGFFISIPARDSHAVCEKLHEEHLYLVPLAAGVRVAVCGIPKRKIPGIAARLKHAMEVTGQL